MATVGHEEKKPRKQGSLVSAQLTKFLDENGPKTGAVDPR